MKIHTNNLSQFTILMIIIMMSLFFGLSTNAQTPYAQSTLVQTEVEVDTNFFPKLYGIVYDEMKQIFVLKRDSISGKIFTISLVPGDLGYDEQLIAHNNWKKEQDSLVNHVLSKDVWFTGLKIDSSKTIYPWDFGFKEYVLEMTGIDLREGGNRSPLELINLGGCDFDISWLGPHTTAEKDGIKAGFTHSVEKYIISNSDNPVDTKVMADFSLGGSVLAVTTIDWVLTDAISGTSIWYPAFLVEELLGGNSNGTNPNLMYVTMHEFGGHGMGFQSSANYNSSSGIYSFGWSGSPNIFDLGLRDGNGAVVWDNPNYQSSSQLGALFTSDDVWYELNIPAGEMIQLYAPTTWSGQAISHLDDEYGLSTNQLMTPFYNPNTIHLDVGWIVKRVHETNGWTLNTMSPPVADFSVDNQTPNIGQTITFTDLSTNTPVEWLWNFGDGNTSTDQNPTHSYSASGTYTVTLTVTNWDGEDEEVKVDYITVSAVVAPTADFSGTPT